MAVWCSACGAENPSGAKFCGSCGELLPSVEQLPDEDALTDGRRSDPHYAETRSQLRESAAELAEDAADLAPHVARAATVTAATGTAVKGAAIAGGFWSWFAGLSVAATVGVVVVATAIVATIVIGGTILLTETDPTNPADPTVLTWMRVPHDEAVFGTHGSISSVTAGGPGFIAVGTHLGEGNRVAAVWTSPDGLNWSRVPHDESVFGGRHQQRMHAVARGDAGLVAVGSDGQQGALEPRDGPDAAVWTSPDGLRWLRVPHDEPVFGGEDPSGIPGQRQSMEGVTAWGSGFVAVGNDLNAGNAVVWSSVDGMTWVRNANEVSGPHGFVGGMLDVVATASRLVAVGAGSSVSQGQPPEVVAQTSGIWLSQDGITWSGIPHDDTLGDFGSRGVRAGVAQVGQGLVAVGWEIVNFESGNLPAQIAAAWVSPDGLDWSRVPHNESVFGTAEPGQIGIRGDQMLDVAVGEQAVVAVGYADGLPAVWVATLTSVSSDGAG